MKIPSKILSFIFIFSIFILLTENDALSQAQETPPGEFEGVITMQMTSPYGNNDLTYTIKGHKVHLKFNNGMISIADYKAGTSTSIFQSNKTYYVMNIKELVEKMPRNLINPKIQKTGKLETIAGIVCEHYIIEGLYKSDICVAKNLLPSEGMSSFFKVDKLPEEFRNGGFPLKVESEIAGTKTTMITTSVERENVDDSIFEVPAGYKKMEMTSVATGKRKISRKKHRIAKPRTK